MNAFLDVRGIELWNIAGWTMLHFLWIGTLIGAVAGVLRLVLRRRSASARYVVAVASLAMLAAAPVAIAAWLYQHAPPADIVVATAPTTSAPSAPILLPSPPPISQPAPIIELHQPEPSELVSVATPVAPVVVPSLSPVAITPASAQPVVDSISFVTAVEAAIPYLPYVWLVGAPITLALLLTGVVGTKRLGNASQPILDGPVADILARLTASLRITRRVTIAVCDRIGSPVLIGIVRPMILLPPAALTGWSPDEIEMVLLHELAHVRRYDNLINLIQRFVESMLFFHPAVWLTSNWARRERETCCDALVVAKTNRPHAYAELLVTLASQLGSRPQLSRNLHSAMAAGPLRSRIRQILQLDDDPMLISGRSFAVMLASLVVVATLVVLYAPAIGQAEPSATERTKGAEEGQKEKATETLPDAEQRSATINNLKNLSLALLNYNEMRKSLPPQAKFDASGKPLLSWRVLILPVLGEEALYKEFHLDEPWDSEHNRKLIARMPAVFKNPRLESSNETNYLAVVGNECVFTGTPKPVRLTSIADGTAHTIALVEADADLAVDWTKPQDWNFDRNQPLRGLGKLWPHSFNATWVDGSTRNVALDKPAEEIGILFTRNGGETKSLIESADRQVSNAEGMSAGPEGWPSAESLSVAQQPPAESPASTIRTYDIPSGVQQLVFQWVQLEGVVFQLDGTSHVTIQASPEVHDRFRNLLAATSRWDEAFAAKALEPDAKRESVAVSKEGDQPRLNWREMGLVLGSPKSFRMSPPFERSVREGLEVVGVEAGSPGDWLTIKPGYIVTTIDRFKLTSLEDAETVIKSIQSSRGAQHTIRVVRTNGSPIDGTLPPVLPRAVAKKSKPSADKATDELDKLAKLFTNGGKETVQYTVTLPAGEDLGRAPEAAIITRLFPEILPLNEVLRHGSPELPYSCNMERAGDQLKLEVSATHAAQEQFFKKRIDAWNENSANGGRRPDSVASNSAAVSSNFFPSVVTSAPNGAAIDDQIWKQLGIRVELATPAEQTAKWGKAIKVREGISLPPGERGPLVAKGPMFLLSLGAFPINNYDDLGAALGQLKNERIVNAICVVNTDQGHVWLDTALDGSDHPKQMTSTGPVVPPTPAIAVQTNDGNAPEFAVPTDGNKVEAKSDRPEGAEKEQVLDTFSQAQLLSGGNDLLNAIQAAQAKKLYVDLKERGDHFDLVTAPVPKEAEWSRIVGDPPRKDRVIADKAWQRLGLKLIPLNMAEGYYRSTRGGPAGVTIIGGRVPHGLPLPAILTKVDGQPIGNFDELLTWLESRNGQLESPVKCYAIQDGHEFLFDVVPPTEAQVAPSSPREPSSEKSSPNTRVNADRPRAADAVADDPFAESPPKEDPKTIRPWAEIEKEFVAANPSEAAVVARGFADAQARNALLMWALKVVEGNSVQWRIYPREILGSDLVTLDTFSAPARKHNFMFYMGWNKDDQLVLATTERAHEILTAQLQKQGLLSAVPKREADVPSLSLTRHENSTEAPQIPEHLLLPLSGIYAGDENTPTEEKIYRLPTKLEVMFPKLGEIESLMKAHKSHIRFLYEVTDSGTKLKLIAPPAVQKHFDERITMWRESIAATMAEDILGVRLEPMTKEERQAANQFAGYELKVVRVPAPEKLGSTGLLVLHNLRSPQSQGVTKTYDDVTEVLDKLQHNDPVEITYYSSESDPPRQFSLVVNARKDRVPGKRTSQANSKVSGREERLSVPARIPTSNAKFPSLEDQKLVDLAYQLLKLELEPLGRDDLKRVNALGYDGGIKVVSGVAGLAPGEPASFILPNDILVGLHVWPTTSMKELAEVLNRDDLNTLNPMKFYVIRKDEVGGTGNNPTYADAVHTGRVKISPASKPKSVPATKTTPNAAVPASIGTPAFAANDPWIGAPSIAPTDVATVPHTNSVDSVPAISATPEELEILREHVNIVAKQYANLEAFQKSGKRHSLESLKLAAYDLALAQGELAMAEGHSGEALQKFGDARARAEEALAAAKASYDANRTTYDVLLQITRNLSDIKLKLLRLKNAKGTKSVNSSAAPRPGDEWPNAPGDQSTSQTDSLRPATVQPTPTLADPTSLSSATKAGAGPRTTAEDWNGNERYADSAPVTTSVVTTTKAVSPYGGEGEAPVAQPYGMPPMPASPPPLLTPGLAGKNGVNQPTQVLPTLTFEPRLAANAAASNSPALNTASPQSKEANVPILNSMNGEQFRVVRTTRPASDGTLVFESHAVPISQTALPTPTPVAGTDYRANLRYDGKTFDQWRTTWSNELSTTKRLEAIKALASFGRAGYGKEAAEAILDVAGQYDFYVIDNSDEGKLKETVLDELAPVPQVSAFKAQPLASYWVPDLSARLEKEPKKWSTLAQYLLSRLQTDDEASLAIVRSQAASGDAKLRGAALAALVYAQQSRSGSPQLDDETRKLIDAALQSKDPAVVRSALNLLVYNPPVTGSIVAGGEVPGSSSTPQLRYQPVLLSLLLFHVDEGVRRQARETLPLLDKKDASQVVDQLLAVLKDKSRRHDQIEAMRALAAMGAKAAKANGVLFEAVKSAQDQPTLAAAFVATIRCAGGQPIIQSGDAKQLNGQAFDEVILSKLGEDERDSLGKVMGEADASGAEFLNLIIREDSAIRPSMNPSLGGGGFF